MGYKYTIQAGVSDSILVEYGSEYLVIALWKYLTIKVDNKTIFCKTLKTIN